MTRRVTGFLVGFVVTAVCVVRAFTPGAEFDGNSFGLTLHNVTAETIEFTDETRSRTRATYREVSGDVFNYRCLLGGGRKIIRHVCSSEDPPALEIVFTRDVNRPEMVLFSGLSEDNGISWKMVGPMTQPDDYRDRSHCIAFCDDLTYLGLQQQDIYPGGSSSYITRDIYKCLQAYNPFTLISNQNRNIDELFLQQVVTQSENCIVYWSFVDFSEGNPYITYVRRSMDGGESWSPYLNFTETIGTDGFDMAGMDGPLMMDADGEFIAALAMVGLDPGWARDHGMLNDVSYPAYTQSTNGGISWDPLRLVWGNDGSLYPQGHSGDPEFDETLHYIGGVSELDYTAFLHCQDNVALTSDGLVHLTYTMDDTTDGYQGVFHTIVDNGVMSSAFVGWPEDPELNAESGVGVMSSIATTDEGHIIIGWEESVAPNWQEDICYNFIPAGQIEGRGPVNVTNTERLRESYPRIVDRAVTTGEPGVYYIDWLFLYYGVAGNAADSTLWHLQTTSSLSTLILTVTPDDSLFPSGGILGFTITAINNTDSTLLIEAWTEGETPSGEVISPILGPTNWIIGPGHILTAHFSQRIPVGIPDGGPFIYRVKAGEFPEDIIAEDSFEFFITSKGRAQATPELHDEVVIEGGLEWLTR